METILNMVDNYLISKTIRNRVEELLYQEDIIGLIQFLAFSYGSVQKPKIPKIKNIQNYNEVVLYARKLELYNEDQKKKNKIII